MSKKVLRQPIVVVLGHVDHGKTTLLDKIRGTAVVKKEPGEMTQEVGASLVPASVIEKLASPLRKKIPIKLEIPGLLFIDTPGHELFSNLRVRGGSVSDIAILVVDVMEGFQNQTKESLELLRARKVPFIVAANKIDRIPGWKVQQDQPFLFSVEKQDKSTLDYLDRKIYEIVVELSTYGINSDRFDRVSDFTKAVTIIPVSGKTGEGIPELLAILAGLTQHYMKARLRFVEGSAKGVVMEVKEELGLGTTIDVILYDGILRKNDTIVLAGSNGIIVTKVKGILVPKPLQDMKMKADYSPIDEAYAASGIKITASDLDYAIAGSPLYSASSTEELEKAKKTIEEEVKAIKISSDTSGVVVKADSLGTLEAIVYALKKENIPIRLADIGPVSKKDVMEAQLSAQENEEYGAILAFRVKVLPGTELSNINLFQRDIIYQLIDDYLKWIKEIREEKKKKNLNAIVLPAKFKLLPGYVFRRSEPIIVGVEVLGGILRPKSPVIDSHGRRIGEILQIQDNKKTLDKLLASQSAAVSIRGNVSIGRQISEGDVLFTDASCKDLEVILSESFRHEFTSDVIVTAQEILNVKRRLDPTFCLTISTSN
ncbi:translation initiation factor aIF-2 [Sulfolobales archaeon HS-7]|nr:translation initiation factor aIF-2 [Sulfolobales archaeon HS-7]